MEDITGTQQEKPPTDIELIEKALNDNNFEVSNVGRNTFLLVLDYKDNGFNWSSMIVQLGTLRIPTMDKLFIKYDYVTRRDDINLGSQPFSESESRALNFFLKHQTPKFNINYVNIDWKGERVDFIAPSFDILLPKLSDKLAIQNGYFESQESFEDLFRYAKSVKEISLLNCSINFSNTWSFNIGTYQKYNLKKLNLNDTFYGQIRGTRFGKLDITKLNHLLKAFSKTNIKNTLSKLEFSYTGSIKKDKCRKYITRLMAKYQLDSCAFD